MDCVENCGYNNLSLSRILARNNSSTYVGNVGIYGMGRDTVYQR